MHSGEIRGVGELIGKAFAGPADAKDSLRLDKGRHIGGLTHFDLLAHPAVYDQVHAWAREREPNANPVLRDSSPE